MSKSAYVGRLPPGVNKQDLEDHFKTFGRVVEIRLMSNFGFVEFENVDDVEAACRGLDGKDFMGERLIVERARDSRRRDTWDPNGRPPPRGAPRGRGVRVSVIGINQSTSWQDLKDFGRQGCENVMYADIDHYSGNGVIEFPSMADAEDAIRRLNGADIQGVPVKLEIAADGGRDDRGPPPRDFGRDYDRPPRRDYDRYDDRPPRRDFDDRDRRDFDRPPRRDFDRYDDRPPRRDFDDRRGGGGYDDRRGGDRDDRGGYGGGGGRDRSPPRRERDYPPREARD
jgi:arginine/serine-rich splicing factor 4/5/6